VEHPQKCNFDVTRVIHKESNCYAIRTFRNISYLFTCHLEFAIVWFSVGASVRRETFYKKRYRTISYPRNSRLEFSVRLRFSGTTHVECWRLSTKPRRLRHRLATAARPSAHMISAVTHNSPPATCPAQGFQERLTNILSQWRWQLKCLPKLLIAFNFRRGWSPKTQVAHNTDCY
jgi:hypothetical protein